MTTSKIEHIEILILGAGVTGLAAGYHTNIPVYEAEQVAGGICTSYYIRSGSDQRQYTRSPDEEDYRFEIGGGHWIFSPDIKTYQFIDDLCDLKKYSRRASIFFKNPNLAVPFPLQNNLAYFPKDIAEKAFNDLIQNKHHQTTTYKEWLHNRFGDTLCELFFDPFHNLYTAGLYDRIAPQDDYKTPVNIESIKNGMNFVQQRNVGYNVEFYYPRNGLNDFIQKLSEQCHIFYNKRATAIDTERKLLYFRDGTTLHYSKIFSTIPLNRMLGLTDIDILHRVDPCTSVLVVNIGAFRGSDCPDDHWMYIPESQSGFHRIGFYSNVEKSFLPRANRNSNDKVSMYIEKAFTDENKPSEVQIIDIAHQIVEELIEWRFITKIEVVDPTWIDIAYTWSFPQSEWREEAQTTLARKDIHQIGRYARWNFQGIAQSINEGLSIHSELL